MLTRRGTSRLHATQAPTRRLPALVRARDPCPQQSASWLEAGSGRVEVELVDGKSSVTRACGTSPLKLLTPRWRGTSAWVCASTFGGGLVAGDAIALDVRVGEGAACALTTQSATKVYRSPDGREASQVLRARVAPGALLVLAPDPLMLFRDAIYRQVIEIDVAPEGALVALDALVSGRRERGESWAFRRFESRFELRRGGELSLADGLLLTPDHGPIDGPFRLGRFHCLATAVIAGEPLAGAAARLCEELGRLPVERRASLIEAASPVRHGVLLRIAGINPEEVVRRLRLRLALVQERLGEAPWSRKW